MAKIPDRNRQMATMLEIICTSGARLEALDYCFNLFLVLEVAHLPSFVGQAFLPVLVSQELFQRKSQTGMSVLPKNKKRRRTEYSIRLAAQLFS